MARHRPVNSPSAARSARRGVLATCLFFAFTTPLGIAAHLISEVAGLGWHDDADVAFSARHGYLALLAAVSLAVIVLALRAVPRGDRRARVAELVDGLPFRGRGAGFILTSFLAQFGFFALTQIGEGCPLCSGDVVVGMFAAAIAALLGAFAVALGKRRMLEFVLALAFAFDVVSADTPDLVRSALRAIVLPASRRRTPFAFRYRPPPALQLA